MRRNLQSVLVLKLQVLIVQRVDTINHGLHQLNLGVSQPAEKKSHLNMSFDHNIKYAIECTG